MDFVKGKGRTDDIYIDGDADTNTEGTPVLSDAWVHPMKEIINVQTAAGIDAEYGNTTQLAQAIQTLIAAGKVTTINLQNGTAYTPVLADAEALVLLDNSDPVALSIAVDATTDFPIGTTIAFQQVGAGLVTMGGAGITFYSRAGLISGGQYAIWSITKVAANTWSVVGDLTS
ncbi:hypothetical protein RYZ26_15255 [Terasakiella sp. A23]|uniref:hypothetical protein n=1 Tax=Terasakiella sp. FCG-A23 TaxID=3080561 RepID=UPI00295477B5|nr:hypothetical protein [Terasakiella sp. A23]MDV7340962.1 hypothetical protein [Terasakiella sp. A23]